MSTNYEFHQLKTKLSAATTPPVQEMGHVLARDPAAPSQFPPPPPTLLPVFCEPSVSNGMLLSLIWLVKLSHRAKNSVTKTSQNLFFIILWQIAVDFSVWGVVGGGGRC